MTVEADKALSDYNAAAAELKKAVRSELGGKKAERPFASTYQRLVTLGLKPQIKSKYRSPK